MATSQSPYHIYQENFGSATTAIEDGVEENLLEAVMLWHEVLINEFLVGPRSGNFYRIPGSVRKKYQASAPGEAPAQRTGRLRTSYRFRIRELGHLKIGEVGSPLPYSVYLERGTRYMKPRPHLMPAYQSVRGQIKEILGRPVT